MMIFIGICGYIVGFFISLLILHRYGEALGHAHYDPPHGDYYDDYESNAVAFASFSAFWPLFWVIFGAIEFGRSVGRLSEAMGKRIKKDESNRN